jgi:putative endonuclease
MFFTYILKSEKDNKRYIGHTDNIELRLKNHNEGLNPSTKNRRPLILLCYKVFSSRIEASRFELYLKKLKGGNQLLKEIDKMITSMPR